MKKITLIFASAVMLSAVVYGATRVVMVSGAGMGIDSDQGSADQTADSQAQNNLQNACPGTVTSSRKIFDQCSAAGGNYVCNVNYTGMCQVGN